MTDPNPDLAAVLKEQTAVELDTSMFNAYYELREATIHVPSLRRAVEQAKEKGVAWDPQVFCLLDNAAQKNPTTWSGGPMEWKR